MEPPEGPQTRKTKISKETSLLCQRLMDGEG